MERPNKELFTAAWTKYVTTGQVAEALGMSCEEYLQMLSVELPTEEKERILAVIARLEYRAPTGERKPCDSVGILVTEYSQIIMFRDEEFFLGVLEANPHLKAIYGTNDDDKRDFPGLYIAAN